MSHQHWFSPRSNALAREYLQANPVRTYPLPPQFLERIADARKRLLAGESIASIRERHGGIVLEEAKKL